MQKVRAVRAIGSNISDEGSECQLCNFLLHMVLEARANNRSTIPKDWSTLPVPGAYTESELREFRVNPAGRARAERIEQDAIFCCMVKVTLQSVSEQERLLKQHGAKAAYNSRKWYDLNTVDFEWEDEYSVDDGNSRTFHESRGPFRFRAEPGM